MLGPTGVRTCVQSDLMMQAPISSSSSSYSTSSSSSMFSAVPNPSNEIWVMDAAREETLAGTTDRMAELDGADDIIQIVLPSWCNSPMMMSVLWIDSWLLVTSAGQVRGEDRGRDEEERWLRRTWAFGRQMHDSRVRFVFNSDSLLESLRRLCACLCV